MKKEAAYVFHGLMKKGWIDRVEHPDLWRYYEASDVIEDLEVMATALEFDLIRSGNRLYIIPTQNNDLFLKNNIDFRKDISANNEIRKGDLFLMNYFSIYLVYIFYHGEGIDPKCREFISKEDAIKEFTEHCKACVRAFNSEESPDYSSEFIQLADVWLSKIDGNIDSMKFGEKYGVLNRLLIKFNAEHDDLFFLDGLNIHTSRKLDDLISYFLRKDRVFEIHEWIKGVNNSATIIEN